MNHDQNPTLVHLDPARMAQVANSRAAETDRIENENEHESGPLPVAFAGRVQVTEGEPIPRHGNLMTHLVIIAFGLLMAAVLFSFYFATSR